MGKVLQREWVERTEFRQAVWKTIQSDRGTTRRSEAHCANVSKKIQVEVQQLELQEPRLVDIQSISCQAWKRSRQASLAQTGICSDKTDLQIRACRQAREKTVFTAYKTQIQMFDKT